MYERKPKGLQAIASAIALLRADFRAKDDARAVAMQELSLSVDTMDEFWQELSLPGTITPEPAHQGQLMLCMGPPARMNDKVLAERRRIYQLRRKKLVGIYEKHNPEKLSEVDNILRRFKGREATLFEMLEKKYTLEVAFQTERNKVATERDRIYQLRRKKLVGIYEKHNPEKLSEVDNILSAYAGRESLLFERLEKKYLLNVAFATPANKAAAERDRIHQLRRKKLVGIYEKHNPEKLPEVDNILRAYVGREAVLFERLEKKYALNVAFGSARLPPPPPSAQQQAALQVAQREKQLAAKVTMDDY
eukprot:g1272.t1